LFQYESLYQKGTVSGLDVLQCHKIFVKMPYHNYTNIEYGENINFQADTNDTSQLNVIGSLDVTSNGFALPVNPFINIIITEKGIVNKNRGEFPGVYVCEQ